MNRAAPERRWAQGSSSPPLFLLPNAGSRSTERDPASQTVDPAFFKVAVSLGDKYSVCLCTCRHYAKMRMIAPGGLPAASCFCWSEAVSASVEPELLRGVARRSPPAFMTVPGLLRPLSTCTCYQGD